MSMSGTTAGITEKFESIAQQELAFLGGPIAVTEKDPSLFHWPIVTEEDENAVIEVLRAGTMSGTPIAREFEKDFVEFQGTKYALSYPNGTMSLQAAMWAVGLRRGDEIISTSMTYWATAAQALALGVSVLFADIQPDTLNIDPSDIERLIGPRTKAIVVVHYAGYPADMDAILAIAKKHDLKVIEDVSHAQGSLYKGRKVGTFGHVSAMSLMAGKSLAIGEGGILVTDDQDIYERAILWSHYERHPELTNPELKALSGYPFGGVKGRLNQTCAAMGRVQLNHYPKRIAEIQKAMNRFWDMLEGTPGIIAHRPPADSGSTMGGWYSARGLYDAEQLGGLPLAKFVEAVKAEGTSTNIGANIPMFSHAFFNQADIYGDGKPTNIAFADRDVREVTGDLPVASRIDEIAFGIPWFKHDRPDEIAQHAAAFRKVALNAEKLLS